MTLLSQACPRIAFAVVAVLALGGLCSLPGQNAPASLKVQELKTLLNVVQKKLAEAEARAAAAEARNAALAESLAESNRLLASLRLEHEELMLRMASLGVDLLKPDPKSLEQRLLNTVRERDEVEKEKEAMARQMLRLSEATVNFLRTAASNDVAGRQLVESELQAANEILAPVTAPARKTVRSLGEGQVVSIDPEIGLVVLNVGKESGIRVGMPLRILRADAVIGTALVVDVRDAIAGAVLQRIAAEGGDVKVGDRFEPEARKL